MTEIVSLVIPFFGMIFLGAFVARITRQPLEALGWMNTFVVYIALPALFFQLLSRTPIEQLTEWRYIFGAVLATYICFLTMFAVSMLYLRSGLAESTVKALAASYGNIGFMGPGLALLSFGAEAAVPVALIFCFENAVHFAVAPMLMAVARGDRGSRFALVLDVGRKIAFHPFIIATLLGGLAAWAQFEPPLAISRLIDYLAQAAAPCALFAMGVTLALRPLTRVPTEIAPIVLIKLVLHPAICYVVLSLMGNFDPVWVYSAVLLAALPTATNVFVIAQQYEAWIQRASASIVITTLLSVATVTALLYAIKSGLLPPDLFP